MYEEKKKLEQKNQKISKQEEKESKRKKNREAQEDLAKPDVIFKEFWRDNIRFADLFNGVLFNGKPLIEAKDLEESAEDVSGIIESAEVRESLQRVRDVVKKTAYGTQFVLLGIENQMGIHYAMPLRTMVYDALGYVKEVKEIGKIRAAKKQKMTADEFLSNFGKEDKITPIITIVIYYGKIPWDGPKSLKDMMPKLPEEMEEFISDYKMNLVEILEENIEHFKNEDVKLLFAYSQAFMKKDKVKVEELNLKYNINKEVVYMIGKIVDGVNLLKVKDGAKEEGNMCEYLQDIWDDGEKTGERKGEKNGEKSRCKKDIINIMDSLEVSIDRAMDILKIPKMERTQYLNIIESDRNVIT